MLDFFIVVTQLLCFYIEQMLAMSSCYRGTNQHLCFRFVIAVIELSLLSSSISIATFDVDW